jgi:hypothetical protein
MTVGEDHRLPQTTFAPRRDELSNRTDDFSKNSASLNAATCRMTGA